MILFYEKPSIHVFHLRTKVGTEASCFEKVTFNPGKNEMAKEKWEELNKQFKKQIDFLVFDSGDLKIFEEDEERKRMSALTQKQAKELIDNTMDIDELKSYILEEKRKTNPRELILKMIDKQIDVLSHRFKDEGNKG